MRPSYEQLLSYVLISTGILVSIYFFRQNHLITGMAMGAIVSAAGLLLILIQRSLISAIILDASSIVMAISLVVLAYFVSDRKPRVFILLGMLLLPIVQSRLFPFPLQATLLAYAMLSLAVLNAYDFSGVDLAASMSRADKGLRWSLWPSSILDRFARRVSHSRPSRHLLASLHLISMAGVFLSISLVVPLALKGTMPSEGVLFAAVVYLFVSREECSRGLRHLK